MRLRAALGTLAALGALAACGDDGDDKAESASSGAEAFETQADRGQRLYGKHCASCHGAKLEGQPNWTSRDARGRLPAPPHDDSGHTWHHDDQVLFEVTKYGIGRHAPSGYESDMPAFGKTMSDAEIIATLAYIKSRWSPSILQKRAAAGMN